MSNPTVTLSYLNRLLDYCATNQLEPMIIALPYAQVEQSLLSLLAHPAVSGIVCGDGSSNNPAIGSFDAPSYHWQLPPLPTTTIAALGPHSLFSFQMILSAYRQGIRWLVYTTPTGYHHQRLVLFLINRLAEKSSAPLKHLSAPLKHFAERCGRYFEQFSFQFLAKPINRVLPQRAIFDTHQVPYGAGNTPVPILQTPCHCSLTEWLATPLLQQRFEQIIGSDQLPLLSPQDSVPGRIVALAIDLRADGTAVDLVNTLRTVVEQGYHDITLLYHPDDGAAGHFFHQKLDDSPVTVRPLLTMLSQDQQNRLGQAVIDRLHLILRPLPAKMAEELFAITAELLLLRTDVIHLWYDNSNVKGGLSATVAGVPKVVMTLPTMSPDYSNRTERYLRAGYQALLQHHNLDLTLIAKSYWCQQAYRHWLALPEASIQLITSAIPPADRRSLATIERAQQRNTLGITEQTLIVGTQLTIRPENNFLLWVECARVIAADRPDVRFLLIADEPLSGEIERLIQISDIADYFILSADSTHVALLDLALYTTTSDGIAHEVLEAQQLGVPVVLTDNHANRDLIDIGNSGWLIESCDPSEIAERVLFVLNHPCWRQNAAQYGPAWVASRYDWSRMAQQTLAVYDYPALNAPVNFRTRDQSDAAIEREVDYALNIGMLYLKCLQQAGINPQQCAVLELGPGVQYGAIMIAACYGAIPTVADRFPAQWQPGYHPIFYRRLIEKLQQHDPTLDCSKIEAIIAAESYPDTVLKVVSCGAEEMTMIPSATFDVTVSHAVFEHLHSPARAFSELSRVTKNGGYGFHTVDFRDHRDFSRPLEYLLFAPLEFERFFRRNLAESGRQYRPDELTRLFLKAGFQQVDFAPDQLVDPAYLAEFIPRLRATQTSSYCHYRADDLTALSGRFSLCKKA